MKQHLPKALLWQSHKATGSPWTWRIGWN